MADLGDDAGGQGKAHGAGVVLGLLGGGQHLVQGAHLGGLGPGALIHEEDAGHAPAGVHVRVGVHVVRAHDRGGLDVVHVAHLGGHVKVHDIAGVVAIEIEHAGPRLHGLADLIDLLGAGRLEHAAHGAAVQQILPHIAQEQGQVARAAAGDDGDLAGDLLLGAVAAQIAVHIAHLIPVGPIDALEHIVGILGGIVDDLFHGNSSYAKFKTVKTFLRCGPQSRPLPLPDRRPPARPWRSRF